MFMQEHESESLGRLRRLPLRRKVRLAWRLRRDPRVSRLAKLPLIAVIAYIVTPINIIPRWLPVVRRLDNFIIAVVGLWLFVKLIPHDLLDEHLSKIEKRPYYVDTTAEPRS